MGYTTWFCGQIDIKNGPLTDPEKLYLQRFAEVRHMARNHSALVAVPDPIRENVGLTIGSEGEYFVYSEGLMSDDPLVFDKDEKRGLIDYNRSPHTQPGLWCHWIPTANGKAIEWDEGEKFYEWHLWLQYIVKNFMEPWGYTLEGEMTWTGEEPDDRGHIHVLDNMIDVVEDVISSPRPHWEPVHTASTGGLGPLPKGMEHPTPKADYSLSDDIDWPEFGRLVGDV
jgi:hypothetical protein